MSQTCFPTAEHIITSTGMTPIYNPLILASVSDPLALMLTSPTCTSLLNSILHHVNVCIPASHANLVTPCYDILLGYLSCYHDLKTLIAKDKFRLNHHARRVLLTFIHYMNKNADTLPVHHHAEQSFYTLPRPIKLSLLQECQAILGFAGSIDSVTIRPGLWFSPPRTMLPDLSRCRTLAPITSTPRLISDHPIPAALRPTFTLPDSPSASTSSVPKRIYKQQAPKTPSAIYLPHLSADPRKLILELMDMEPFLIPSVTEGMNTFTGDSSTKVVHTLVDEYFKMRNLHCPEDASPYPQLQSCIKIMNKLSEYAFTCKDDLISQQIIIDQAPCKVTFLLFRIPLLSRIRLVPYENRKAFCFAVQRHFTSQSYYVLMHLLCYLCEYIQESTDCPRLVPFTHASLDMFLRTYYKLNTLSLRLYSYLHDLDVSVPFSDTDSAPPNPYHVLATQSDFNVWTKSPRPAQKLYIGDTLVTSLTSSFVSKYNKSYALPSAVSQYESFALQRLGNSAPGMNYYSSQLLTNEPNADYEQNDYDDNLDFADPTFD